MPQTIDLKSLSDEDLQIYEDLLKAKQPKLAPPAPDRITQQQREEMGRNASDRLKEISAQELKTPYKADVPWQNLSSGDKALSVMDRIGHVPLDMAVGLGQQFDKAERSPLDAAKVLMGMAVGIPAGIKNALVDIPLKALDSTMSFGAGKLKGPVDLNNPNDRGSFVHDPRQLVTDLTNVGIQTVPTAAGVMRSVPAVIEAAPKVLGDIAESVKAAPHTASDMLSDKFKPTPEITALRASRSAKPEIQAAIPKVLDELGQWSDESGQPVRTVKETRAGIDGRMKVYNQISDAIAAPHNDATVPGSRARMAKAKIEAIPEDIRLDKPRQYQNLVKSIQDAENLPDYTIGELNDLRKSLNDKNNAAGKNRSLAMKAEHSTNAIEQAAGKIARNEFYDALEKVSGQGEVVRELKARTGAMIEYDNALRPLENQSILESGKSLTQKGVELAGKAMTPGSTLKHFGENATINSDIASAVRRWKRRPAGVLKAPVGRRLALTAGSGEFSIDPSAAPAYGHPNPANMLRSKSSAEPMGIPQPYEDVTPAKPKMLPSAPDTTTHVKAKPIPREARTTVKATVKPSAWEMPPKAVGVLEQYLQGRKKLGEGGSSSQNSIGSSAAELLRERIDPKYGVPSRVVGEMAAEHLNSFADMQESGIGDATGKPIRAEERLGSINYGYEVKGRIGGFKKSTIFKNFPESPSQIAKAIRKGSGPLFERAREAALEAARTYTEWRQIKKDLDFSGETESWD